MSEVADRLLEVDVLEVNHYGTVPERFLPIIGLMLFSAFFIESFETSSVFILETLEETSDNFNKNFRCPCLSLQPSPW